MSTLLLVLGNFVGIIGFLYIYWTRLKEDYTKEQIFSSGLYSALGGLALSAISFVVPPLRQFLVFFLILGILVGFLVGKIRFNLKFWEGLDGLVAGVLFLFLCNGFWPSLILLIIFAFVEETYRKYSWYRSGRAGIAGSLTAVSFFVFTGILAIFFRPGMISFGWIKLGTSLVELSISFTLILISIISIVKLSKEK